MNKILIIGLLALVFSSCQSESGKKENVMTPTPNGMPSTSTQNTPAGQKPAKNPAHGQPFHDCALPVGAALATESMPSQPGTTSTPVDLQQPINQGPTTPAAQGVKLNPAHGAPGHTCALPVGAPLS